MPFQSHAGSIEAPSLSFRMPFRSLFQSHAGSIEANHKCESRNYESWVSIPRWFD